MEENKLILKAYFNPTEGGVYSVCMRGARLWDKTKPLIIFDPSTPHTQPVVAEIISQPHFVFSSLDMFSINDNYNEKARTWFDLRGSMVAAYPDFEENEIVTILRFKITKK